MNAQTLTFLKFNLFEKRHLSGRIACFVFIIALFFYAFSFRSTGATIISLGAISLFAVQFIYQFKAINGILGGIMLLVSIYFSLAVWSEFSEFEVVTQAARELLMVGWSLCFAGIILALLMIVSAIRDFAG